MKKYIVALAILAVLLTGSQVYASSLTNQQIYSVIALLQAFNVDPATVLTVQNELFGITSSSTVPIIPVIITISPVSSTAPTINPIINPVQPIAGTTQPINQSHMEIKAKTTIKADGNDDATIQVFIYDTEGSIVKNSVLHIETDDASGFERPGGYTDGQSPTVMSYDMQGTAVMTRDDNHRLIPVYAISYTTVNKGVHTFTFTSPYSTKTISITAE